MTQNANPMIDSKVVYTVTRPLRSGGGTESFTITCDVHAGAGPNFTALQNDRIALLRALGLLPVDWANEASGVSVITATEDKANASD